MAIEDFAQYKILKRLGKGGMGEVFLAEDIKLARRIALKFLSAEALLSKEQIHRFEQEALAISSLNHPNILTIYEIGQSNGREYLATEFVDGKTLREFLSQEKPELEKIVDIAVQIGAALETAHEQGIIHRDIKPENIMIRRDGLVKILDFGLAKLVQKVSESAVVAVDAEAPTRANLSTAPGLIMGTSFYLSPEQARGKTVDARTDIWSFGVVLYEAVTKNHPFKGETTSDVIASILKTEPLPLELYVPDIPAELQRIVKKMLQKDREDRYQTARDLLVDLKNLNRELSFVRDSDASIAPVTQPNEPHPQTDPQIDGISTKPQIFDAQASRQPNRLWAGLAAAAFAALIVFSGWYFMRRVPETAATTTPLAVTQLINWKNDLGEKIVNRARFSPDGKLFVFSSTKNGKSDIWVKQVGGGEAIQITKDAQSSLSPVWSADGGQIAFLSERSGQNGIWKMPALGGAMTLIQPLDSLNYNLVHWSKDGQTIYYERNAKLYALDTATQHSALLTNFDSENYADNFRLSSDEEKFVFVRRDEKGTDVWTLGKNGGEPRRLTEDSTEDGNPVWTADGRRVIYNSTRNGVNQINVVSADGQPPVQLNVGGSDGKILDISPDGSKVLFASERNEADLWGVKLDTGREVQLTSDIGLEVWADVSPDSNAVAFQTTNFPTADNLRISSIMKTDIKSDTSPPVLLAEKGFAPRWSPDKTQLAFLRTDNGKKNIWIVGSDGGNAHQITNTDITFGGNSLIVPYNLLEVQDYQWSSDGQSLIYCAVRDKVANVWQINADGTGEKMLSANTEPNLIFFSPAISPDGQRFAWLSLLPDKKMTRTVWVSEAGKSRAVYQASSLFHIIGWSVSGNELIIKSLSDTLTETQTTKDVDLFALSLDGATRPIAKLPQTHFSNIKLSPDRKQIAFVSRPSGLSSLQIIPSAGGAPKTIITGNDARVYFSNLVWSPDLKTIYYGKQASWSILSMIENFN